MKNKKDFFSEEPSPQLTALIEAQAQELLLVQEQRALLTRRRWLISFGLITASLFLWIRRWQDSSSTLSETDYELASFLEDMENFDELNLDLNQDLETELNDLAWYSELSEKEWQKALEDS